MQYIKNGNCLKVARITGPKHNILGLVLRNVPYESEVVIVSLSEKKPDAHYLSPVEVKEYVLNGVANANRDFCTTYTAQRIEFRENDSPPADIYTHLAQSIIERLVKGQAFTEVTGEDRRTYPSNEP